MMSDCISDSKKVCNKKIGIDEYNEVYEEVESISARWKQLAIYLGIRPNDTDTIEANYRGKAEESLGEILKHWLKGNYDQRSRHYIPSWKNLCVAVKKAGDPELATKIGSNHKANTSASTSSRKTQRQSQSHHDRTETGRVSPSQTPPSVRETNETSSGMTTTPSVQHNAQKSNPSINSTGEERKLNLYDLCIKCGKVIALSILLIALSIVISIIVSGVSSRRSNIKPHEHTTEFGDAPSLSSSAVITFPDETSSVVLKLIMNGLESLPETAIYVTDSIPPIKSSTLPPIRKNNSGIQYLMPFNYNGGDYPIYLLPGSIITFSVAVNDSSDSKCPAKLVLFNTTSDYFRYKCNPANPINATLLYCLNIGFKNVSMLINESARYFVVVSFIPSVSVTANLSVHYLHYDTYGLPKASKCGQLSSSSSCKIENPNPPKKPLSCSRMTDWYVVLTPKSHVYCQVNYSTSVPLIDNCNVYLIWLSVLFVVIILLFVLGLYARYKIIIHYENI